MAPVVGNGFVDPNGTNSRGGVSPKMHSKVVTIVLLAHSFRHLSISPGPLEGA